VAEFYSNLIPPYNFAQILAMVGKTYNNGLIVVEDNGGYGTSVLEKLSTTSSTRTCSSRQGTVKNPKPGIKTTLSNRPKFLEAMQTRLINSSIAIRSASGSSRNSRASSGTLRPSGPRPPRASTTTPSWRCVWPCTPARACTASMPVGIGEKMEEYSEAFKAEIFDEIKRELAKDAPETG
jgi:hypothetical protein